MKGNQFYIDGRLYRFDYSGTAPPWPLQVWNDAAQIWEAVAGASSGRMRCGGPLALTSGQYNLLDWAYLITTGGLAVLTASGEAIATQWPTVVALPKLVLTQNGDIIRC